MNLSVEREAIFWTCDDDAETLSHTDMDEAVEEHLDKFFDFREPASAALARMPETVTAYGMSRRTIPEGEPALDVDALVERILEDLAEEYGDPDGCYDPLDSDGAEAVKLMAGALMATVRARYRSWSCEQTTEVEVNVKEWIAENRPDWLEVK